MPVLNILEILTTLEEYIIAIGGVVEGINSFGSLASIIGLMIGGLFYNLLGATTFLISAGVIFTVFILSFRLLRIRKGDW